MFGESHQNRNLNQIFINNLIIKIMSTISKNWSKVKTIFQNMFSKNKQITRDVKITNAANAYKITENKAAQTKAEKKTFARDFKIINARPEGMSFEAYREHLKAQNEWIKNRKKGFLVYLASEIRTIGEGKNAMQTSRKYQPFVGVASKLKPI